MSVLGRFKILYVAFAFCENPATRYVRHSIFCPISINFACRDYVTVFISLFESPSCLLSVFFFVMLSCRRRVISEICFEISVLVWCFMWTEHFDVYDIVGFFTAQCRRPRLWPWPT